MFISRIIGFSAATVFAVASFQTKAANAVESFSSNASVAVTCKLNTPTNITVTYDAFSNAETVSTRGATVAILECTSVRSNAPPQSARVSFSEGLHPASGSSCSAPLRQMNLNGRLLPYRLVSGPKASPIDMNCSGNLVDLNTSAWVNYCNGGASGVHEDGSPYCLDMVDGVFVETPMSSKPNYTGNVKQIFSGNIIIAKQQDVAEGTYADTITVTVTF